MIRPGRDSPRYEPLRASRRSLARMGPMVQLGLLSVGVSMFLDQAKDLVSDAQFTWGERQIMGIVGLSYLGSFGLGAWVIGRLISTSAGVIDVLIDQAEAASRSVELIEIHALPTLTRIALALETPSVPPTAPVAPPPSPVDDRSRAAEIARRAIAEGRWASADRLVGSFVRDFPGQDAARLMAELDEARNREIEGLRSRLADAESAGDGLSALDLRDELTQHLRGPDLDVLDRRLAKWLVGLIRARVRAGTIRSDVATLASRVVDGLGDTPEGAALRGSLPNLRRSAGLCPRCGRPHRGDQELCPRCSSSATVAGVAPSSTEP